MCTKCFQFFLNCSVLHMKGSMFQNHFRIFYKCALLDFSYLNMLNHYYGSKFVIMVQNKVVHLIIMSYMRWKQKVFIMLWAYLVWKLMSSLKICAKKIIYIKFSSSNSSWRYVQNREYDLELRKWNLWHL